VFVSPGLAVVPGQERTDLALAMPIHDGGEGLCRIAVRLDPVQLAGFYEGGQRGPILGPGSLTGEETVLATDGDGLGAIFEFG